MRTKSTIDALDAGGICRRCLEVASSIGASISVAIVDESGSLLRFARMDRVAAHTVDIAMRKARSAATTGVSTRIIDAAVRSGKLMNVETIGWGGIPLEANGECVGAVGISGASTETDEEIALRVAATFEDQLGAAADNWKEPRG